MTIKPILLWTDALIVFLLLAAIALFWVLRKKRDFRQAWQQVLRRKLAIISLVILAAFLIVGLLDSLHFQVALPNDGQNSKVHYNTKLQSVLDALISPLGNDYEKTYSAPFARTLFVKQSIEQPDGTIIRDYPRLEYAAQNINSNSDLFWDISKRILASVLISLAMITGVALFVSAALARKEAITVKQSWQKIKMNHYRFSWRLLLQSLFFVILCVALLTTLAANYHVFGTNKVGQDVLYQTIKSIRTGLVIGTLTTLIMLPFAILLGISAGFFGGIIDDAIQYFYTTLSSIPGVLLIAASVLSLQVYIGNHPELFHTLAQRADARLLALCIILGVTSWTGLCRMLRAETLKVREVEYIQAAHALGTNRFAILMRHILPNVMHIVLIAVVLDFSTLVLAEAVLSYVGVGVDPSSISWGNMINSARLELAREPIVWWPLFAAFVFMFLLVLAANLFADAVRDGFDPRALRD